MARHQAAVVHVRIACLPWRRGHGQCAEILRAKWRADGGLVTIAWANPSGNWTSQC